jgi:phosphoserine aminotransferase
MLQLSFEKNEDPLFRVRNSNSSDADGKIKKPSKKPSNPEFSSGPCKKRPGYSLSNLRTDVLGRSHRSKLGKGRIVKAMEDTKRILGVPSDYFCGIVPASDTGAMEMSMVRNTYTNDCNPLQLLFEVTNFLMVLLQIVEYAGTKACGCVPLGGFR